MIRYHISWYCRNISIYMPLCTKSCNICLRCMLNFCCRLKLITPHSPEIVISDSIKTDPKTFTNMKKRLPSVELERFDTPEETLAALKSGKVAAIIGENRDFWALLTKNRDLKISVDSLETMESARPIFRQEDRELEEAVSAEIRTLTSTGKLKEIYSKNFKAFYGGGFNCDVLIPQDKN